MQLERTSKPSYTSVVSLATAKAHLRVDHSSEDSLITELVKAAGEVVESYTGLYLGSSNWKYHADYFPGVVHIHAGPEATVTSVKYHNAAGTLTLLDSSKYHVDTKSHPIRVQLDGVTLATDDRVNAVQVAGTAGYTVVPSALKQAMLLIIGHLYEHRKDVVMGVGAAPLPMGARYLMDKFRPQTL